ncbi:MAG: toprim domain-containing protein, partial [Candidatus Colwellbacteria bacterium]|nr:toprim domain-containing protein [Candidatus Colwellbacteria bacterium]
MKIPEPIKGFVDSLSQLPGIGPRQAIRIAFHLAGKTPDNIYNLAKATEDLARLTTCPRCFYIHEGEEDICEICASPVRDDGTIAIIEKETDVLSMENTGKFNGVYLVLGSIKKTGGLSDAQKVRIDALKKRMSERPEGKAKEMVLALSPTTFGDMASKLVEQELGQYAMKLTRL